MPEVPATNQPAKVTVKVYANFGSVQRVGLARWISRDEWYECRPTGGWTPIEKPPARE